MALQNRLQNKKYDARSSIIALLILQEIANSVTFQNKQFTRCSIFYQKTCKVITKGRNAIVPMVRTQLSKSIFRKQEEE